MVMIGLGVKYLIFFKIATSSLTPRIGHLIPVYKSLIFLTAQLYILVAVFSLFLPGRET